MRRFWFVFLSLSFFNVYAFSWNDLWLTKNQQAQIAMKKGQFKEAEETFQNPDWRATAAYRAGNYEKAAKHYLALQTAFGFYNEGNALAHLGKYEEAIKAYNAALAINPKHQDALYNRKLLQDLLKKNKDQQGQNQEGKDKKNKDQQGQNQQDKNQQNQNQKDQDQKKKEQPGQNQEDKNQQDKNRKDKDQQNQKDKNQQSKEQQTNPTKPETKEAEKMQSAEKLEKQQAKEQWLRLIPDDPAGLMREKFLRDHLRREEGWYQ